LKTTEKYRAMEKGKTNNPNGRPKGVPNKSTGEMRAKIQKLVDTSWKAISKDIQKMPPKDRVDIVVRLLPYVTPKLQVTDLNIDIDRLTDEQLDRLVNSLIEKMD
jgi:hypothetical protein